MVRTGQGRVDEALEIPALLTERHAGQLLLEAVLLLRIARTR
jgi:hypothetical protein